jgi:hypothetical protein
MHLYPVNWAELVVAVVVEVVFAVAAEGDIILVRVLEVCPSAYPSARSYVEVEEGSQEDMHREVEPDSLVGVVAVEFGVPEVEQKLARRQKRVLQSRQDPSGAELGRSRRRAAVLDGVVQ